MDKEIKEKLHIEKVVNTGRLYPMKEACEQTGLAYETLKFGSIINVGVRKYSFLTPFLHKKVDIDGIHSYN